TADGPTLAADGSMWFRNTRFAQFDGKLLVLEEIRLFQGHYRGEVREAPVEWIELTGDSAPAFMQVSTACSRREAALGAAAVFIVLSTE
ncbi:MAG TPA: hypothetical protein VLC09_14980, partial [Polyangiaceae bacterium]|nr:hypothetical protein [Polyangiaceae bacterium]